MTGRGRHLPAFYAFTALWYLRPTSALWILYLLHSGWTLWQVGVAEAAFHAVHLVSDLPTGAFADRYGRRLSMAVGIAIGAVQPLVAFVAAPLSVPLGSAAIAFGALAYTFVGGADRALLYGIAAASPGGSHAYGRIYGRVVQVSYLAETLGAAAGGILVTRLGWAWPYGAAAASQVLALACLFALPAALPAAPGPRAAGPVPRSPLRLLAAALAALRERPALLRLVLFGGVFLVATTLTSLYAQSTLVLKGASVALCTLLIAASNLCAALTSAFGGRLAHEAGARGRLRLGAALVALQSVGVGALPLAASAAAFLAVKGTTGLIDPIYESRLNAEAPEAVRATVLSAPSTFFSLGMVALFPLAGLAMSGGRLFGAYAGIGLLLAAGALSLLGRPARGRGAPAAASPSAQAE